MRRVFRAVVLCLAFTSSLALAAPGPDTRPTSLSFVPDGQGFRFNTGDLKGALHAQDKALGLTSVIDAPSGTAISGTYGIFSHYRLLDGNNRYGTAAWDWSSQAKLLPDGAVQVRWAADAQHPLDMTATYRWASANTLDLTTEVTAHKALPRFEVFLASYFDGFPESLVYAKPAVGKNAAAFLPATRPAGVWQAFPRDAESSVLIKDGRWTRPPNPVDWQIMPQLQHPLAIRRDPRSGLTAILMSKPADCFAVLTPCGDEPHRSLYLSLFGRDLKPDESATAAARLVIGRDLTQEQIIQAYNACTWR